MKGGDSIGLERVGRDVELLGQVCRTKAATVIMERGGKPET